MMDILNYSTILYYLIHWHLDNCQFLRQENCRPNFRILVIIIKRERYHTPLTFSRNNTALYIKTIWKSSSRLPMKGNVSIFSNAILFTDLNARFTTVSLKPWSDQKCGRYPRFFYSKNVNFCEFLNILLFISKNQGGGFLLS